MAGVMPLEVPFDGWTVDDLPDDDYARCRELVDGALVVSPAAELRHDEAAMALWTRLLAALPAHLRALTASGVHVDRRNYRVPDVVVYDRAASARGLITAADVLLAVEVMSPGSVSTDRVTKPAQYAAAGIPHFWRLELDPLLLVVHRLAGSSYEVVAELADVVELAEPVPVAFRLGDLLD